MRSVQRFFGRGARLTALALALFCAAPASAQQGAGALRGTVTDDFGGVIIGAVITATDAGGARKTATTNDEGVYVLAGLAPGTYIVRASAGGFAEYESAEVVVAAGRRGALDIRMGVALEKEEV
ncbi:MAG: carboxypeptidase-like regulatory domain-containing protein, partial [Pyrinomonadaceae bacterium]